MPAVLGAIGLALLFVLPCLIAEERKCFWENQI